jgi:hypothetical protein
MKHAAIEHYLVELVAAAATAAALILTALPVQAQSLGPRDLNRAEAERLGLTLPSPRSQMNIADAGLARDRLNAEFERARAAGEREPFEAERYGLTLPNRVN